MFCEHVPNIFAACSPGASAAAGPRGFAADLNMFGATALDLGAWGGKTGAPPWLTGMPRLSATKSGGQVGATRWKGVWRR